MIGQRAGPVVTVGEIQIEPIEHVVVHVQRVAGGVAGMALKRPVAVVIRTPAGSWRVDLEEPGAGR